MRVRGQLDPLPLGALGRAHRRRELHRAPDRERRGRALRVGLDAEREPRVSLAGELLSALWLIAYALPFAIAYLNLTAGTGALILFGFVQLTMIGHGVLAGERLRAFKWLGLGLAIGGLVYLCAPGVEAPPLWSATLMAVAGIAWGFYSLRGRAVTDPVGESAGNFARAALMMVPAWVALSLTGLLDGVLTREGVLLALASGALTSGLGYAIWYAVLPALKSSTAATVQLTVPIIAAAGGAAFVHEALTLRLISASVLMLSGVLLAIVAGNKSAPLKTPTKNGNPKAPV